MGNRQAGRRLAGRGLRVEVTDRRGGRYTIVVALRLGAPENAVPIHPTQYATTPSGQGHGTPADLHHEYIGVTTTGHTNLRSTGVPVSTVLFGAPEYPLTGGAAGLEVGLGGETSAGQVDVSVTASMRQIMYEGTSSYFQMPGARWQFDIDVLDGTRATLSRQVVVGDGGVLISFPTEITQRDDVRVPEEPEILMPVNPTPAQKEKIRRLTGGVFHAAESIAGMDTLVDKVLSQFPNASPEFVERVESSFSELDMFRLYAHLSQNGVTTAQFPTGRKTRVTGMHDTAGFLLRSSIKSIQRVDTRQERLKIESRRFAQGGSFHGFGSSIGLKPFVRAVFTVGDVDADRGDKLGLNIQAAANVGVSSSMSTSSTTGSGEWRGVAYDGPVAIYKVRVDLAAKIFANDKKLSGRVEQADGVGHPARAGAGGGAFRGVGPRGA